MCRNTGSQCTCKLQNNLSENLQEAAAPVKYKLAAGILDKNAAAGEKIRTGLMEKSIFTVNIMGSAGAGKTSLLEKLLPRLGKEAGAGVIEGDLFTRRDAERIARLQVPVVQINTSGGCHLNATQVAKVLPSLPLDKIKLLFIENVGNLVCPAEFDLGENIKMVVLSVTEGDDKPAKYPLMFLKSGIIVLNKFDLLKNSDFDLDRFTTDIRKLNINVPVFKISCRTGSGLDELSRYIKILAAGKQDKL